MQYAESAASQGDEQDAREDPFELVCAATRGDAASVASILSREGADVDAPDEDGSTPLIAAAWNNQIEVLKVLVDRKAGVNRANHTVCVPTTPTWLAQLLAERTKQPGHLHSCLC